MNGPGLIRVRIASCPDIPDIAKFVTATSKRGSRLTAQRLRRSLVNSNIIHDASPGANVRELLEFSGTRAALDVASGFVIGKCDKRHRAKEFLAFLKEIDARAAGDLDIHIIMDNCATHNEKPKPFKLTKSADDILASVKRFCHRVEKGLCTDL